MASEKRRRVLAIAAHSGAIAWVLLIDDRIKARMVSQTASQPPTAARSFIRTAIAMHKPDFVVLENPNGKTRKKGMSIANLKIISHDLADQGIKHVLADRKHSFNDKYEEAQDLANRHPELRCELGRKPRRWEKDPKEMLFFEAVSMARVVQSAIEIRLKD
jgi:hypothetical protein